MLKNWKKFDAMGKKAENRERREILHLTTFCPLKYRFNAL